MATCPNTLGHQHAAALSAALVAVASAPLPGARDQYKIVGLKLSGGFIASQENTLVEVSEFLAGTQRVFIMTGGVYIETHEKNGGRNLVPLTEGAAVVVGAEHRLANLMICAAETGEFPVPKWFTDLLLRSELLHNRLPEIRTYARRPVFDVDLMFRNPGWHPEAGVLVHGPTVDPQPWHEPDPGRPALERLPSRLRALLGGFCFKSDTDLANLVGFLLTALLVSRYVETGKPIALVNGNQPGVGKSLIARVVGVLADGQDPPLVPFTPDEEELRKTIGAHLRDGNRSVIGLDNAKVAAGGQVDSPALEALVSGSELALRVLGTSTLARRPNDVVWLLTMNDTKASDDLVRRGLPVCLEHEGDPSARALVGDPVQYARTHRTELLGELAGMVDFWTARDRPTGTVPHRFKEWAGEVGGIMRACGFPEFLTNMADAATEFSGSADDLTALAEHVTQQGGPGLVHTPPHKKDGELTARQWVPAFLAAKVLEDELAGAKNDKAKATRVGQFFARSVGKAVTVSHQDQPLVLVLRAKSLRSNGKAYFFEVGAPGAPVVPPEEPTPSGRGPSIVPPAPAGAGGTPGNDEAW